MNTSSTPDPNGSPTRPVSSAAFIALILALANEHPDFYGQMLTFMTSFILQKSGKTGLAAIGSFRAGVTNDLLQWLVDFDREVFTSQKGAPNG